MYFNPHQTSSSSTVDSSLWTSLQARLKASDMTEQDLRECSPAIQKQILLDILGFDIQSSSILIDMMRENRIPNQQQQQSPNGKNKNNNNNSPLFNNNMNSISNFIPRQPGSVEWSEIEESLTSSSSDNSQNLFEVRHVAAVPSSCIPPSLEKDFRTTRIESGCQPERLFRFCSRKHLESVSISCNIFDSYVPKFDCALNKHGQVIGRTLVTGFSKKDLKIFGDTNRCILGVDALVTKPVAMTMSQFRQWCATLNDSQEAHQALAEHGATCIQIIPSSSQNDDDYDNEFYEDYQESSDTTKIIIFDSTISLLRAVAFTNIVHDSYSYCAPATIAARGCPSHNFRKFEFWNRRENRLMCSMCLYQQQKQNSSSTEVENEILVVDDAVPSHIQDAQNFRSNLKSRQQQIAKTLSHLEVMQDTFSDRADQLRQAIEDSFNEIRRLVDLQEADCFAAFDLSVRGNAEDLSTSCDLFQRYETDCDSYLKDADDAIYQFSSSHHSGSGGSAGNEATKILGLVELAKSSGNGDDLDLGKPEEHSKNHDLPTFQFDREEIISALRNACKLFSFGDGDDDGLERKPMEIVLNHHQQPLQRPQEQVPKQKKNSMINGGGDHDDDGAKENIRKKNIDEEEEDKFDDF